MLKITVLEELDTVAIKVEGRLGGAWLAELDRTWRTIASSLGSRQVSLDLCDMTYADTEGKRLLREIYQASGASFVANTPLSRYFAAEATRDDERESES